MANDSIVPNGETNEIDIDDLEVEIFILAKNPNMMKSSATFLNRRGWPTTVLGNVSAAIEYIVEKRPDFILVSLNHPSSAIERLPELVVQTFNLVCIGFLEAQDAKSMQKLTKMKMRHKIPGQASGPNLHRSIRNILAEKFNITESKAAPQESANREIESGDSSESKDVGVTRDQGLITQKAERGATQDLGVNIIDGERGDSPKGKRKSLKELMGTSSPGRSAGDMLFGEGLSSDDSIMPVEIDLAAMLKKSLFGEDGVDKEYHEEATPQVALKTAVESALTQICGENRAEQAAAVESVKRVGVFPVNSDAVPGYLVMGMANGGSAPPDFLHTCEGILRISMQTAGVPGKIETGFWLEVPNVLFDMWANAAGLFNFKMNFEGGEVGVAFFKTEGPINLPVEATEKGMHRIDINEISTEHPVTFKAYIYLEANNKFYLYLRNGRQLQPEQKKRLQDNNINNFYMKSVDLENLRIFLASCFLKNTITAAVGATKKVA